MPRVRIVLVEPREAGNVGAVARAMKNFGLSDLWIVGEHPQLLPVSGWWASGADDLLESARFTATLAEALADAHLTVATTSMRGRTSPVTFTARTLATKVATLAGQQVVALVFGREDRGLTTEELALCQFTAAVPTNEAFPTMNLAQSLCLFAYELSGTAARSESRPAEARELPDAATIERIHERAKELLLEVGFLHEKNREHIYADLRAVVARASLDAREAAIALGIIRQIEWKLRQPKGGSDSGTPR
jgi:tRNA/rRNA methyltransferase